MIEGNEFLSHTFALLQKAARYTLEVNKRMERVFVIKRVCFIE